MNELIKLIRKIPNFILIILTIFLPVLLNFFNKWLILIVFIIVQSFLWINIIFNKEIILIDKFEKFGLYFSLIISILLLLAIIFSIFTGTLFVPFRGGEFEIKYNEDKFYFLINLANVIFFFSLCTSLFIKDLILFKKK
jgi:hypothetical protein